MMYLTEAIRDFDGTSHEMVGLFPAEAVMQKSVDDVGLSDGGPVRRIAPSVRRA